MRPRTPVLSGSNFITILMGNRTSNLRTWGTMLCAAGGRRHGLVHDERLGLVSGLAGIRDCQRLCRGFCPDGPATLAVAALPYSRRTAHHHGRLHGSIGEFLTAPAAYALGYMSMDLTALVFGKQWRELCKIHACGAEPARFARRRSSRIGLSTPLAGKPFLDQPHDCRKEYESMGA